VSSKSIQDITKLQQLLELELEEDRQFYKTKIQNQAIGERKKQGLCWYPVESTEYGYSKTGQPFVVFERKSQIDENHQFQFGGMVSIFKNIGGKEKDNPSTNGVITAVRPNKLKIQFSLNELPDWITDTNVGIDMMFDEVSYREMKRALEKVKNAEDNRLAELREVLLGYQPARVDIPLLYHNQVLNESQNQAVQLITATKDIAIVHGPPGTGKTTTLIETIIQTIKTEKQTLVVASSNAAIDLITDKLNKRGVQVVRIGNPARISEELFAETLDAQMNEHPNTKELKKLRKQASEYRRLAGQYKRNFGYEEREQRKLLVNEARQIESECDNLEFYILEDILARAEVITATLVGSAHSVLRDRKFNTVFIDEAGQALEPACWIAILRANRVILAGDHKQLPPTVKSRQADKEGLANTLFEKSIKIQKNATVMLNVQYRMNQLIMEFPSKQLYHNDLIADALVKDRVLSHKSESLANPVEFIDTAGTGYNDEVDKESKSTFNSKEAELIVKHINNLFDEMTNIAPEIFNRIIRIGIISPYKAQVNLLKEMMLTQFQYPEYLPNISINTIDGFQGQERDIIYISLVRSNDNAEIGFLSDIRRMNVALTRAKMKLVVIGDSATIGGHPFYEAWVDYAQKINSYKSAWEYNIL